MALDRLEDYFPDWKEREELAEKMIPIIGKLYRKNIVTYCFGRALYNKTVTDIMSTHRFVRQVAKNELSEFESYPILKAAAEQDCGPCHFDLGQLTTKHMNLVESGHNIGVEKFVAEQFSQVVGRHIKPLKQPQDVILYGFGRIGRLMTRLLIEKTGGGDQLRLRAVVLRPGLENDLKKRAMLLRHDSVHGEFPGTIRIDEVNNCLIINGNVVRFIYTQQPDEVDYEQYGIQDGLVIDNTGVWRDETGLGQHLKSKGVSRVIVTAPSKGTVPNIVSGINSSDISKDQLILSAGSCTTNAIVPVLKVVDARYGIKHGHMETVHAYTPDQNLLDNFHRKDRRGRAAPLNLVITETGASKAVAKLLPQLEGKLTGNAIRVPTPNVSLAILSLSLKKPTTKEDLNTYLRDISLFSPLQRQIDFTFESEVVSSDFIGNRHACTVDGQATIVANGKRALIYVWYDNEFGFCCQVIRVIQKWIGIRYPLVPVDIEEMGFSETDLFSQFPNAAG
ncbi:MAG: glyceraldehyde-3-phosphate dehydrogenase [Gammaproteobacteria bacterium]|nr:glyceraldehyde-3-phosphate dehydrogenase [Gammaproteobacteria bacterium]MDE0252586.1 glyceraldehyde-3-phosphate dehydrogenase [Gammaproteobacteria bacterium]MDE0403548.1 glyceraldehyde-3-phosphate dehydrogenase [Gammaproteobacteria bacterium]